MKKCALVLFFLFSFIFFSTNASAIGIGPARTIINFEPNYEDTITYVVVNGGTGVLKANLYVSGDLRDYITLSMSEVTLGPGETKTFECRIKLPAEITPGRHDIRIGAGEAAPAGTGTVAALAAVESQLWIDAPYPGKYVEASFAVTNAALGGLSDLTLSVTNKGKDNLTAVSADVSIYDAKNEIVGNVKMPAKGIVVGDTAELKGSWKGEKVGVYRAIASISYDGSIKTVETEFKIGDLLVEITGVRADEIAEGNIGKISVDIDSLWNEDIEGVYVEVDVNGEKLTAGPITLGAWSNATLVAFWDTKGVAPGNYDASIIAHYSGKTATKAAVLKVGSTFNLLPYAAAAIIIIILLFIFLRRKKKALIHKKSN